MLKIMDLDPFSLLFPTLTKETKFNLFSFKNDTVDPWSGTRRLRVRKNQNFPKLKNLGRVLLPQQFLPVAVWLNPAQHLLARSRYFLSH